jgi:Glycosyl transferases group 1
MSGQFRQHGSNAEIHNTSVYAPPNWRDLIKSRELENWPWDSDRVKRELLLRDREIQRLREQLRAIHNSEVWAVLRTLSQMRHALAPRGTWRDRLVRCGVWGLRRVKKVMTRLPSIRPGPRHPAASGRFSMSDFSDHRSGSFTVICLPIIEWSFRFQRPQQLMRQFASSGHPVIYAANRFHGGSGVRLRSIEAGILEAILPGDPTMNVYQRLPSRVDVERMADALEALAHTAKLRKPVVLVQLPFWTSLSETLRSRLGWPIVYDCMDAHDEFLHNTPAVLDAEAGLIATADLLIASSDRLYQFVQRQAKQALLVQNGCDYEHFKHASRAVLHCRTAPIIGYYGAIADWFDSMLVAELAIARPDWKFELIGSTLGGDVRRLEDLANVRLLGECPYPDLPRMILEWDVHMIPFKRTPLTDASNPVKVYEMLASGKPVVAVPLPELETMMSLGLVRGASDPSGFVAAISAALAENSPQLAERRRAFARENTWGARQKVLSDAIEKILPDRWADTASRKTQAKNERTLGS